MIDPAVSVPMLPILALKPTLEFPVVMTTLAGIVIRLDVELNVIVVSVGAGCDSVAVHEITAPDITPLGVQDSEVTSTGAMRGTVDDCDEPLYEAVTEPLWLIVKGPACKVNPAELDPAAIATGEGALSTLLVTDTTTPAPPAAAFFVNVTVQVLEVDGPNVAGTQTSEETSTGATRPMVALAELSL